MSSSITSSRLGRGARAGVAALALFALSPLVMSCSKSTPTLTEGKGEALPPVPAPAGLVAEIYIPKPNATWAKVRASVAGPMLMLPPTFPMLALTALGLPPASSDEIDADVPAFGVITSDGKSETPVLALHVKSGGKLLSMMTTGPDAKFDVHLDEPSGISLLDPKQGQSAIGASLGVSGNYLLVGYTAEDLRKLGPYATRTLPTKALPGDDIVLLANKDGLAGPLRARVEAAWNDTRQQLEESDKKKREANGGSAPSFADPNAAIGKLDASVKTLLLMMGDVSEGRLTINFDERGGHIRSFLKPQSPEGPAAREIAEMLPGSVDALLDLPSTVSVAMLTRSSAEARARTATEQGEALDKLFAGKLTDADKKRLDETLSSWSKGRGDWLLAGVQLSGPQQRLFARSAVADAAALDKGLLSALALLNVPAFAEPVKHWLGAVKLSPPAAIGDGQSGQLVKIEHTPTEMKLDGKNIRSDGKLTAKNTGKKGPSHYELGWVTADGVMNLAIAPDAKAALAAKPSKEETLRGDAEIQSAIAALGDDASFALLLLPTRIVASIIVPQAPPTQQPSNPVLVSLGRTGGEGWFRVDASPAALREIAKVQRAN